ncbi:MAG: SRPBCC family protein [Natronohydrobacter sp.]|nr:SRPBCC family protein [Natronohydrobacter sp.]
MDRQITQTIRIAVPAERVWVAVADVIRWPDWASTITSVHQLDGNGLKLGARFRIKQPMQPTAIWEVTELSVGKCFSWRSERRFLAWVASHELNETSQQETSVALGLGITGRVNGTLWHMLRPVLSIAIKKECADLKAWCER